MRSKVIKATDKGVYHTRSNYPNRQKWLLLQLFGINWKAHHDHITCMARLAYYSGFATKVDGISIPGTPSQCLMAVTESIPSVLHSVVVQSVVPSLIMNLNKFVVRTLICSFGETN